MDIKTSSNATPQVLHSSLTKLFKLRICFFSPLSFVSTGFCFLALLKCAIKRFTLARSTQMLTMQGAQLLSGGGDS